MNFPRGKKFPLLSKARSVYEGNGYLETSIGINKMSARRELIDPTMMKQRTRPKLVAKTTRYFTAREILRNLDLSNRALTNWRIGTETRRPLQSQLQAPDSNRFLIAETELVSWLADYRPDLLVKWRQACP
jgi:hypothetical protein